MKNIVLYMILILGVALVAAPANAQKPAIELLPTDHQLQHPEAMADTISMGESVHGKHSINDTSDYRPGTVDLYKKEDGKLRRTGWHLNLFHFKREPHRIRKSNQKSDQTLFFKHIHPVQMFIQITALK